MMGHREKLVGGSEYDRLTRWRKWFHNHAGMRALIKSKFNRRIRKLAKIDGKQDLLSDS